MPIPIATAFNENWPRPLTRPSPFDNSRDTSPRRPSPAPTSASPSSC